MKQNKMTNVFICVKSGMIKSVRTNNSNVSIMVWDEDCPEDIIGAHNLEDKTGAIDKYFEKVICKEYPEVIF